MEEEQVQEISVTPEVEKQVKKAPYSAASVRAVAKLENCSISQPIFTTLNNSIPILVKLVPHDKLWNNDYSKSVMCSKEYFKYYLGKEGLPPTTREIIRKNIQTLLTKIITLSCKQTKQYKKKIINAETVETFINFFRSTNQSEDTDMH